MRGLCVFVQIFAVLLTITPVKSQRVVPLEFLFSIGDSGDSLGQFYHPQGVAVDPAGNIYVADTGNHRIQKFDEKGRFQVYLGGIGSGREQFDTPTDVSAPDGLNVYVADFNNHRIHRLDRKLNAVSIFTGDSPSTTDFRFSLPKCLVISDQGDLFLGENETNSILKFNSFYTPIVRFGSIETGEGILNQPEKIELIDQDFVCVSDVQAGRVAVFDYFGNFLRFLGEGVLTRPAGLQYWAQEKLLLVSDVAPGKIFAFDLKGKYRELRPVENDGQATWRSPVDLALYRDRLFVLDREKDQLLLYRFLPRPD